MFLDFLILLRARGMKVSLNEWLTVMEGLEKGLHEQTLTGFYTLVRAICVKSEKDYDLFDRVFLEYFKDVPFEQIAEEMEKWLDRKQNFDLIVKEMMQKTGLTRDQIEELFHQRLQDQHEEHNGGSKWIGTGGFTAFGNHGRKLGGIRVGGTSAYRSAYRVAGERKYRDWRSDSTLDSRQFQMAFHQLRQLSRDNDESRLEFDVDQTVEDTSKKGGLLQIRYRRPRRNTLKLMVLIDSGGSMRIYQELTSLLFRSLNQVNTFSDLKIYYFHNCPQKEIYLDPTLSWRKKIDTDWILKNLSSEYRVIFVGDAEMSPDELLSGYTWETYMSGVAPDPGITWLTRFKAKYPHLIWLHPQPRPVRHTYWSETFDYLDERLPMFRLSIDGLNEGMKKLMENR